MITFNLFKFFGKIFKSNKYTSKDLVNSYIKELEYNYKNIEISYIFESFDNTHLINIESCEDADVEDIAKYESWVYSDFFKKYPSEIVFFTYHENINNIGND